MPTNTLGPGTPGVRPQTTVQDYSYAGVAVRVLTNSPATDADWGGTPPPDGTVAVALDGFMWVRLNGVWKYVALNDITR